MKKVKLSLVLLSIFCSLFSQTTEEKVNSYLERAYASICDDDYYSVNHWMFGESTTDNGESLNDIPDLNNMMLLNFEPCNTRLNSYWRRLFEIIASANFVIDSAKSISNGTQMIAEAKFIRSLAYSDLVKVFGPVPLYTETMQWPIEEYSYTYPDFVFKERASIASIYKQLKTDLTSAAADLPKRSSLLPDDIYRVTSGAAKALLAKVYLYESSYAENYPGNDRYSGLTVNWDTVLKLCNDVINSGEYALLSGMDYNTWWNSSYAYPEKTSAYRYLFTVEGNYNSESVFEAKRFHPENGWTFYGDNGITQFTSPRGYNDGSISSLGWGHNIPTQSLENAFAEETGDPADDPRFKVTISKEGDSVLVGGWSGADSSWYKIDFSMAPTGRYTRKFECSPQQFWNNGLGWTACPLNIRVIRFSDVYLWAAEAAYKLGNTSLALDYLNTVRTRTASSGTSGYPHTLSTITFDDIVHERRLEFAMEGQRYFDLVRWNMAKDVLDSLYNTTLDQYATYISGVNEVFPIPSSVVKESNGTVAQNPGYFEICPYLNSFDDLYIKPDVDSTVIDLTDQYSGSYLSIIPTITVTVSNNPDAEASLDLENNKLTIYYHNISAGDTTRVTISLKDPAVNYTEEFNIIAIEPDIYPGLSEISHVDYGFSFEYGTRLFFNDFGISVRNFRSGLYLPDGNKMRSMYANLYSNAGQSDYGIIITAHKNEFVKFVKSTGIKEFDLLCVFWDNTTGEEHSFILPVKVSDIIRTLTVKGEKIEGDIMTIDIETSELSANDSTVREPRNLLPDINAYGIMLTLDTTKVKFLDISSEGTISSGVNHYVSTSMMNDTTLLIGDSLSGYIYGAGNLVQLRFQLLNNSIADNTIIDKIYFIRQSPNQNYYDANVITNYEKNTAPSVINQISQKNCDLQVYPTFANDYIQVRTDMESYTVQVFDAMGKLIIEKHAEHTNDVVNITSIPNGLYILKVYNSESSARTKFIKR